MAERLLHLPGPIGGVHKGTSYAASPRATASDALNVRTWEGIAGRARVGTRNGTRKIYTAPPLGVTEYSIELDSTGATKVYFNSGADFSAGTYMIRYKEGAWDPGAAFKWTISNCTAYSDDVSVGVFKSENNVFDTVANVESAHSGDYITFSHTSGTIGMNVVDDPYGDNTNSTPGPTFVLIQITDSNGASAGSDIQGMFSVTATSIAGSFEGIEEDDFNRADRKPSYGLGDPWIVEAWAGSGQVTFGTTRFRIKDNYAAINTGRAAVTWNAISVSPLFPYTIEYLIPWRRIYAKKYYVFFRLSDTTPDPYDDGYMLELSRTNTGSSEEGNWKTIFTPRLTEYSSGAQDDDITYSAIEFKHERQTFRLRVTVSGNRVRAEIADTSTLTTQWIEIFNRLGASHGGTIVGIGMNNASTRHLAVIDDFRITGVSQVFSTQVRRSRLLAICNGGVYEEVNADNAAGRLVKMSDAAADIATGHAISGVEIQQKGVIVDFDTARVTGTDGTIGGGSNNELTATGVADWTTLGINTDTDIVFIHNVSGPTVGVYGITSVAASKVTLDTNLSGGGTCSYRIERGLKVYDGGSVALLAPTAGTPPSGVKMGVLYRDRLVLAISDYEPQNWWMSRQNNLTDWDSSQTDSQASVTGAITDRAGKVGDIITALIPYSDDYMIFGCRGSLWLLRGDPMAGGQVDNMSYEVGCVDRFAWAHGPRGEIYIMSHDGLYVVAPSARGLTPVSRTVLPRELSGLNPETHEIVLGWHWRQHGVAIAITARTPRASRHWFYDPTIRAFWPDEFDDKEIGPMSMFNYRADTLDRRYLLLGGRDGYIRAYDTGARADDSTAIVSYVVYRPIPIGQSFMHEGIVNGIDAELAETSDSLDWELRVGAGSEASALAEATRSRTWTGGGPQPTERCRARGQSLSFRIGNDTLGERWAIDLITASITDGGKRRL
ncbi:MAG: hypothetical protein QGD94_03365 [Planctomycetia bacterium]|nr:hypothetical protein [Planctomycetia bacterium]